VLNQKPGPPEDKLARRDLPSSAPIEAGKALCDQVPRQTHGSWKRDKDRVDPLKILSASDKGRLEQLIPIRYGGMLQSPFTFYRGSAAVMAADLAQTPNTGLRVQACGRDRQRWNPLLHLPDDVGQQRPTVPARQGGQAFGTGTLCRRKRLFAPWPKGGDGLTADATSHGRIHGLGHWPGGRKGYVRQLRDAKIKPLVETMDADLLKQYAKLCGWVLARAHAKAGDAELTISGYLGTQDNFDKAMGSFAVAYADRTERDHAALKSAVRAGKIKVHIEE
jgi:hypothetical protein